MMGNVLTIHERDPNFPHTVLIRIQQFLGKVSHRHEGSKEANQE